MVSEAPQHPTGHQPLLGRMGRREDQGAETLAVHCQEKEKDVWAEVSLVEALAGKCMETGSRLVGDDMAGGVGADGKSLLPSTGFLLGM